MKVQKIIEVYLVKKRLPRPIDLVQYDTGVQLVFAVQDFNIPENTTATLYVQKPSGAFVFQETGIVVDANTVTIDLENQALAEHGNDVPYQVRLKNGSDLITTFTGIMRVEKSLDDAGAVESKTVIAAFEAKTAEQIAQIEAATEEFTALAKSGIERKGAETLATIPEDYTKLQSDVNHLFDNAANAIKGTTSGAVVAVHDVSPLEHTAKVKVTGYNLFNPDIVEPSYSSNGLNITRNNDEITISGTTTKSFACPVIPLLMPIKKGKPYTCTVYRISGSGGKVVVSFGEGITSGERLAFYDCSSIASNNKNHRSFVATYDFVTSFMLHFESGVTFDDLVIKVQFAQDEATTEYTPYIDPSTVKVRRCGENLIPYPYMQGNKENQGVEFTVFDNGVIGMKGTSTDYAVFYVDNEGVELENGVAYDIVQPTTKKAGLVLNYTDENGKSQWVSSTIVWKSGYKYIGLYIQIDPDVTIDKKFVPIVKRTSDPLDSYTPAADGTVSGLTSVSPNMTILTDTDGVVVECEYNRDTNKVIERLVNAITALGGTV